MQSKGDREEEAAEDSRPAFIFLCSLAIGICYADRANIADAIIPMSQELGWSVSQQGVLLSSFFVGYGMTQIIGGKMADRGGGKALLAGSVLVWSLATLATPTFARAGLGTMIAARILLGAGEGPAFPAVHAMISRAVPPSRQSTAVGAVTAASYVGSLAAFSVCPYLISTRSWEAVFQLFGSLGLIFLPLWLAFPADFLEETNAAQEPLPRCGERNDTYLEVRALLAKREVLAIVVAQYTQSWGLYGLLNWLPTYIENEFRVPVSSLASFTALPYLLQGAVGLAAGVVADRFGGGSRGCQSVFRTDREQKRNEEKCDGEREDWRLRGRRWHRRPQMTRDALRIHKLRAFAAGSPTACKCDGAARSPPPRRSQAHRSHPSPPFRTPPRPCPSIKACVVEARSSRPLCCTERGKGQKTAADH